MKVAILVLNYNGKALLSTYLGSVVRHKEEAEVWVVDNGSTDESVTNYVKNLNIEGLGSYQYILNDKNDYPACLKFAKVQARNIAKGKYFLDVPDDHLLYFLVIGCKNI